MSALLMTLGVMVANAALPIHHPNYAVNPGFKSEVKGWSARGAVRIDTGSADGTIEIGPGRLRVWRRINFGGLRVVDFKATICAVGGDAKGKLVAQCFDAHDRRLMKRSQPFDSEKLHGPDGQATSLYFKTAPNTRWLMLSIEKTSGIGLLRVLRVEVPSADTCRSPDPRCDLDAYMRPFWEGCAVVDESVLLQSSSNGEPTGKLAFRPTEIHSVKDCRLETEFLPQTDYRVEDDTIVALPTTPMATVKESDLPTGEFPWPNLADRQVMVSYSHAGTWYGPPASYVGNNLPRAVDRLRAGKSLKVVVFGDSISLGMDASGYRNVPPYMPTWPELLSRQLRTMFGNAKVEMFNASLGGATSEWGRKNVSDLVCPLNPDLVLIGFGMNDFWSTEPGRFKRNILAVMKTIRKISPKCEFILIASIKFDPAYTCDRTYIGRMTSYPKELRSLAGLGVQVLDMTELSDYLYRLKGARSLLSDPMHPNDFLARIYAQRLVSMLDKRLAPKTFYVSEKGDDSMDGLSRAHAWRSLARVSDEALNPGDRIVLASGQVFAGPLRIDPRSQGTPESPIVIESIGKPATILSAGSSAIKISNGGIEVHNLVLKGGALAKRKGHFGIELSPNGKAPCRAVKLENIDVSGFGDDGISVSAPKDFELGFWDLKIEGVSSHDNFGSGVSVGDGISWKGKTFAHRNITVRDCLVAHNHSGTGIVISGTDGGLVEFCRATGNTGPGGAVGIWAWAAKGVVIRNCIASGTRTGGGDGGGLDLDGGCVDCVIEGCLAYHNDGPGYMHCDYPGAPSTHHNVIRGSASIDDGRKKAGDNIGFGFVTWGSGLDDCSIKRNLAVLTLPDDHNRHNGLLFVTEIQGSKAAGDVLHVRGCTFDDNTLELRATGSAFVRNGLPNSSPVDVAFHSNTYSGISNAPPNEAKYLRSEEDAVTAGQTGKRLWLNAKARIVTGYDQVAPRQLPKYLESIGVPPQSPDKR